MMTNKNFTYSFETKKSPVEVFNKLLDVRDWWTGFYGEQFKGDSDVEGREFEFTAGGGAHHTKQKLVTADPGKKITWRVTESQLSFVSDPGEWQGTEINFDIAEKDGSTRVTFTHGGLTPQLECFDECSGAWSGYLHQLEENLQ